VPQDFFQFKQFTVRQGRSAMKVSTEACVLGGLCAQEAAAPLRILDIGAGTGLLSLMLAQAFSQASVEAVEIEAAAFGQCQENFAQSPWANRLQAHLADIAAFRPAQPYDFIVSNPPFYDKHLPSSQAARQIALHTDTLPFEVLAAALATLLAPQGQAAVLLPLQAANTFGALAIKAGLHCQKRVYLYQYEGRSKPFREVSFWGKQQVSPKEAHLFFKNQNQSHYSEDFKALLKAYYLYL
jgi:tRNA1Val (adenine37-N6)-methyltransferase